jgi:hypothetical protein
MTLGLSILQIFITILDRLYLSQPLPNKVLSQKTHTQTHHNTQQDVLIALQARQCHELMTKGCSLL